MTPGSVPCCFAVKFANMQQGPSWVILTGVAGSAHLTELAPVLLSIQRGRVLVQRGEDDRRQTHVGVGRAPQRELFQQDAERPHICREIIPAQQHSLSAVRMS